jgi:hypothetical protein
MKTDRELGAYYFRGGMFTLVPDHVRADLDGMAELGTTLVCLAVNAPDMSYNRTNLDFLVSETRKRGMDITRRLVTRFR